MPAPQIILDLVQRFSDSRDEYRSGHYNEAQLRREFLDPFFTALGWDLTNQQGYAPKYREVIQEASLSIEGQSKAPDYEFRIGETIKFFVEAKKPTVNIQYDIHPAFQLRRYAWSAHLPLSILTDFEEFAVYDTRVKPNFKDAASVARTFFFRYTDYAEKWDEIAAIFAKSSILKGSFDRYVQDNKAKKGTTEVDDDFLSAIETWRELLARNIALRNPQARTERALNYAVQMTLDRLIFLRICEDRGIEPERQLDELSKTPEVYPRLVNLFIKADQKYNSGLFHFAREKTQSTDEDTFTLALAIDDKVLKQIIRDLYYPESPYAFKVIPVEILGQVYEQFLGKVIRLTHAGQAKVEEKPEVRKAGGVYYTPSYIVAYIVQNTVGKLLEGKTPQQAASLRVVDPACGSGSFLLGAYQHLLDWHLNYYLAPENGGPQAFIRGKSPALLPSSDGGFHLTTAEKKRILINNIYGVDIDHQAVEVTKLSLLLKLLEEETGQLSLGFERVLPDLGHNIRCGNSLIGWDYFHGQLLADEEEIRRVNPFDWQQAFPEVFAVGGFDAVIGNPPYVRQESLGQDKKYFETSYEVYAGTADLYSYFIERGIKLLAPGGIFSYIVANKWMRASYGRALRNWLKTKCIDEITDFGDLRVFENATTYPCILRVSNLEPHLEPWVTTVKTLNFSSLYEHIQVVASKSDQSLFEEGGWTLSNDQTQKLLEKIKQNSIPLDKYINGKLYRGLLTGLNEAFIFDSITKDRLISEDPRSAELIRPFAIGKDLKRYQPIENTQFLIFIPRGWTNLHTNRNPWKWFASEYPAVAKHLQPFEQKAIARYDKGDYWWELRACAYYDDFEKPKITWGNLAQTPKFTMDLQGFYINAPSVIIPIEDYYLLGILNSSLAYAFISSIAAGRQGGFFEYKPIYVSQIPIHVIDPSNQSEVNKQNDLINLAFEMLELKARDHLTPTDKEFTERRVALLEAHIDQIIFELYGLSEKEISLIDKS
jgi:hypothetical protein